jgi:hypothetical protein
VKVRDGRSFGKQQVFEFTMGIRSPNSLQTYPKHVSEASARQPIVVPQEKHDFVSARLEESSLSGNHRVFTTGLFVEIVRDQDLHLLRLRCCALME